MIAVDTNILVYAHRREVPEHAKAAAVVQTLAESGASWAIPWPCVYEFYSVVTHPKIWKDDASTTAQALAQLDAWRASPTLRLLHEIDGSFATLCEMVTRTRVVGPRVHDARIAALCVAHGVEALLTRDRDFSAFPQVIVRDPLR